jgi:acyl dehydratase
MGVSTKHVLSQGPVIGALIRAAGTALRKPPSQPLQAPTPELAGTVSARPDGLINDYIRHVGGSPSGYKSTVPAHLYPQWGFPLLARTLEGVHYDMTKVLNGGCRIEMHKPLPRGEDLQLRACLESIDDNGSRAILKQRLITGTASAPDAVTCYNYAIVPLRKKGEKKPKTKKEPKRVPSDAREIAQWNLGPKAGRDFALLTGDFNPIHWIGPVARAAGFKNCILHGFSTLARAIEALNQNVWSGDTRCLKTVDVQFTKPLVLPARPRLYLSDGSFAIGDAPGAPAFLLGTFEHESPHNG